MSYTILVTGANGQLGESIREVITNNPSNHKFIFTDIDSLDITNISQIRKIVLENGVQYIINAAAYTAVDKAEEEPEMAFLINETAVANLAEIAKELDVFLIHVSTDYVFDGKATTPYRTEDRTAPVSVYGKSKLAGEVAIRQSQCRSAVFRTSWLYSRYGKNFVKSISQKAIELGALSVVSDQQGAPTYAPDLAETLVKFVDVTSLQQGFHLYHYANDGITTWHEFAVEIVKLQNIDCEIRPIPTSDYPTPAQRPAYSVFDLSQTCEMLGIRIPHWKDSLRRCLQ